MGFDFGQFVDDVGGSVQQSATDWLKNEVSNRLNPVKTEPQPAATQTVAQNDATKLPTVGDKKLLLYMGGAFAALLVLIFAVSGKKSGGRRAK